MSFNTRYALALLKWLKCIGCIDFNAPPEKIASETMRFMRVVEFRAASQIKHYRRGGPLCV